MKKIIVIIMMLIILTGCNSKEDKKTEQPDKKDNLNYEILSNCDNLGSYDYTKRGYYINTLKQPNSPYWYIITMGEKNTGGYSIKIKDVKEENNKVVIIVEEQSPSEGAIVTQAFTYPKCCIKFDSSVDVEIKNTKGKKFDYIG